MLKLKVPLLIKIIVTNLNAEGDPFLGYAIAPNNFLEDDAIGVFEEY